MYSAIVFLPLLGFLIAGLFGRTIGHKTSELLTSSLVGLAALLSWIAFFSVAIGHGEGAVVTIFSWIHSGAPADRLDHPRRHVDRRHAGGGEHGVRARACLFHRLHAS